MQRLITLCCVGAILVLTAWAYRRALENGFVYEDHLYVDSTAEVVAAHGPAFPGWSWPGRSLSTWTIRLNYLWSGDQAWSYHLVNLCVHLLNGLLLQRLLRRVIGTEAALIGMAMFLWHPIQTEAVAYMAGRTELLMVTGLLMALLALPLRWATAPLLVTGVILAAGAKEVGVMVGGLVPLWLAVWWPATLPRWVVRWRAGLVAASALAIGVGAWALHVAHPLEAGVQQPILGFLAMQAVAFWRLLSLVAWPQGLSIDHDYELVPHALAVYAAVCLVASLGLTWLWRSRVPVWACGVAFVALCLLPRFLIYADGELLNEHQLYAPMVGVSLVGGTAVWQAVCWTLSIPVSLFQGAHTWAPVARAR